MPPANIHYYAPNFTSNTGEYKADNGNSVGTFTNMFRSDLEWEGFTDFFVKNFANKDKVNIIQLASSDGSEAYTQIITLLENHTNTDKFFPIKAYDINPDICAAAKSGLINLTFRDMIKIYTRNIEFDNYFENTNHNIFIQNDSLKTADKNDKQNQADTYKVSKTLTNRVKFRQADMFDVLYDHNDKSNTVVLCRNVLDYLTDREIDHFTTLAACRLNKGSLFVIGEIDSPRVDEFLLSKGFERIMSHVFIKQ